MKSRVNKGQNITLYHNSSKNIIQYDQNEVKLYSRNYMKHNPSVKLNKGARNLRKKKTRENHRSFINTSYSST